MKIGIIAASGKAGSHILREALMRNHDATAIVKNKATLKEPVTTIEKDLFDLTATDIESFDYVVNAFAPANGEEHLHVDAGKHLISILQPTNTKLFVVGSAGCLFVDRDQTVRLLEISDYPEHLATVAKYQLQNLENLRNSTVQWTFLSPSAMFDSEGPRTGHYVLGKEHLVVNSQLNSYISYADFAVAVIDEIENANHVNKVFTVASENITTAS
ncbi:NAD(P)H-binding protein [Solibacillus sp. CAU 1738]|uniref:NAD(P)-dependent oxidoreductase n=1 Tax=Solibacillus sp. CAU 1738 TaxID=3140363 RepID=UPI003260FB9D